MWAIIEIGSDNGMIKTTVSKTCKRIRFLQDTSIVFKQDFVVKNMQLSEIITGEYLVFDTVKWIARRDSLVKWIAENQSGLTGFIMDMSGQGTRNYSDAIELFNHEEVTIIGNYCYICSV